MIEEESQHEFSSWEVSTAIKRDLEHANNLVYVQEIAGWSSLVIMFTGFIIGGLWLWPTSEAISVANAMERASMISGLLVQTNFGLGMICFLFAWIVLACIIAVLCLGAVPERFRSAYFLGLIDDKNLRPFNRKAMDRVLASDHIFKRTEDLLKAWRTAYVSLTWKYAVPLLLIGVPLYIADLTAHRIVSEEGVDISSVIPFKDDQFYAWADVQRVELGCNHAKNGSSLIYEVSFSNGKSLRIGDSIPAGNVSWLESMERIDKAVSSTDAKYERWTWLSRDPLHPRCLSDYFDQLGHENRDRIKRLLRFDEL